jgi:type II secretory pathway component PulF
MATYGESDPALAGTSQRHPVLTGIILPLLSIALVAIALVLSLFVVPRLLQISQDFGMKVPGSLQLMAAVPWWMTVVAGGIAITLALLWRNSPRLGMLLAAALVTINAVELIVIAPPYWTLSSQVL